jgi:hypothetical protein
MMKSTIPNTRFTAAVYPNLDPAAEGMVIPAPYGVIRNIRPICIDLTTGKWKLADRAIHAITEVREAGIVLVAGVEYTTDLALAEFTIGTTTVLLGNTTYFFVLESDYAEDDTNYIGFAQQTDGSLYPDGTCYFISAAGAWSDQSTDIQFRIYGKDTIDGPESVLVDNWVWGPGWNAQAYLRKDAGGAQRRLAQSFLTPAGGPWYLSRVQVEGHEVGTVDPARTTKMAILSDDSPETQSGAKSYRMENYGPTDNAYFPQRAAAADLTVDIEGIEIGGVALDQLADIYQDVYVNILGGTLAKLNAADLVDIAGARTEVLAINLASEIDMEAFNKTLEAGQLWKFIPQLDGTFGFKYAATGTPAGTPTYYDPHFRNFKMFRSWESICQRVKIKYAKDGGDDQWLVAEEASFIALYFYQCQALLEVETYLTDAADATALAKDYLGTAAGAGRRQYLHSPAIMAEFDLDAGNGWSLIPMDKVILNRTRGMSATGSLSSTLFRVLSVSKKAGDGSVHVKAILDSQTY